MCIGSFSFFDWYLGKRGNLLRCENNSNTYKQVWVKPFMSFEFKNYRTPEDYFATDSSEEDESSLDSGDGDYIQEADQVKSSRTHMWRIIYLYSFSFLFNKRQIGGLSK